MARSSSRKPAVPAYDNSLTGVAYPCDGGMSAQIELPNGAKASGAWSAETREFAFRLDGKPIALSGPVDLPTEVNKPRSFTLRYVDPVSGAVTTAALVLFAHVDKTGRACVQIRRQKVAAATADFDFLRAP